MTSYVGFDPKTAPPLAHSWEFMYEGDERPRALIMIAADPSCNDSESLAGLLLEAYCSLSGGPHNIVEVFGDNRIL